MNSKLRNALLAFGSVFMLSAANCGGSPLVGRWQATPMGMGSSYQINMELKADGSVDMSIGNFNIAGAMCTGSISYTGGHWEAMASGMSITYSGTPACSGMVTCMVAGMTQNIDCSRAMGMSGNPTSGTQTYSLSSDNNTLTFTSSGGSGSEPITFTRQ